MMAGAWERVAAHEGGTVFALATAPVAAGGEVLFAATGAGLFRSDDVGRVWFPTGTPPLPLMTAVAASSRFAANGVLVAGTETGFFRSTDAGISWRQTLTGGSVFAVVVVPVGDEAEEVFIGTEADGILRSGDGGVTWTGANAGLLDLTVLALAFSPDFARDQTGFAATASGLYRTRNGGKSWREVALPFDEIAVQCLAVSPDFARDRRVFAGTETGGLLRSDDGGASWEAAPGLADGGVSAIAFAARSRTVMVAATADGVAISRDGGETWLHTGADLPPVLTLQCVTVDGDEIVVAGVHRDGVARLALRDADARWDRAFQGLTATLLTQVVACVDGTVIVSGQERVIHRSPDRGRTWERVAIHDTAMTVHELAVVPRTGGACTVFAATDCGIMRSRDAGAHWDGPLSSTDDAPLLIAAAGNASEATVFTVMADGSLRRSDDSGERWRTLRPPFEGARIVSLACLPRYDRDPTVYVGIRQPDQAANGEGAVMLWVSRDGGVTWTPLVRQRAGGGALSLSVPPDSGDTVFMGHAGCVMHPRPHAWESRGGVRMPLWRAVPLHAPDGGALTVTALATSPHFDRDGMVFAATSAGIYRSSDRGRTFAQWSEGIGPVPVLAVTTVPHDGTHAGAYSVFALSVGGTVWCRPDSV